MQSVMPGSARAFFRSPEADGLIFRTGCHAVLCGKLLPYSIFLTTPVTEACDGGQNDGLLRFQLGFCNVSAARSAWTGDL